MDELLIKNFQLLLQKLRDVGEISEGKYLAVCPSKYGKKHHLKTYINEESIEFDCEEGCDDSSIIKGVGMEQYQFSVQREKQGPYPPQKNRKLAKIGSGKKVSWFSSKHSKEVLEVERYVYRNLDGEESFSILRSDPKDFRPLNPDGHLDLQGVQKIPYRLPELQAAIQQGNPVFLVEGEKDSNRGTEAGLCCTTFPGGAGKWRGEYAEYFFDADVLLVPDNDEAGLTGMKLIADELTSVASRVRVLELPGLSEKEDLSNWLSIPGNDKKKLMELVETKAWEWTSEILASKVNKGLEQHLKGGWVEPLPLPKSQPPPKTLDPEILPNPLSEFCRAAALENETAPEAVAGFLLAALGIITGTRLAIKPDPEKPSWFEYGVRSVALVMPVSSNKTAVFRSGLAPLEKIQISKNKLFVEAKSKFESEQTTYLPRQKGLIRYLEKANLPLEKRREYEDELRNLESLAPEEPQKQILITNRATPEKLISLCATGSDRGILLKADELVGIIAQTEKPGSEGLREFFTEAMTVARHFSSHTITRGTDYVENLAISIAGCVQPGKLRRLLKEMEQGYKDDGLLQRFIWIWPNPPSFEGFEGAARNGSGISSMLFHEVQMLFEKLDLMTPEDFGAKSDDFSPSPWISFDPGAQEIWYLWRRNLRTEIINQEDIPEGYVAWLGKSERMVAGLSLTFHCIDVVQEKRLPGPVGSETLERAIEFWSILRFHALRVFSLRNAGILEALHLLASRLHKLAPLFSMRDLKQKNWRNLNEEDLLNDVVDWLIELNFLRESSPVQKPQRGRPASRRFLVNPRISE